ncbi:MAG: ABC transporter substrate-binding protein [Burkholderiales bacterium]|nr:ABC transporter substrate-binding protein [Burkholderiales bacterium]
MLFAGAVISLLSACGRTPDVAAAGSEAVSPVRTPDGKKVLRIAFPAQESGFDPATAHDLYSAIVVDAIFDTLLTYDYLARPAKVVPKITEGMPKIEDDGKRYTIRLKRGIYFSPHEAFGGKKRELTAQDVVYSIKRHFDDSIKPVWRFLIDGKIVGLNEWYEAGKKAGKLDWDAPIAGLQTPDPYTLIIQLTRTDYNFNYILAHSALAVVAREVVERYPNDVQSHPVGSSAYMLKEWVRGQRIVLEKNPHWSGGTWNFEASGKDPEDELIIKQMRGKALGQIDRIEIYTIEEEQSRWLAFKNKELDILSLPGNFAPQALPGGKLAPDLAAQGIRHQRFVDPEYTYLYFQWNDPVWGGPELHKIALRRAVAMAINRQEEIDVIRKGQAIKAEFLVPVGVAGHNPRYASGISYNPALANALLDRFGYKKGSDGYRNTPDGKPFSFKITRPGNAIDREFDELYKKNLDAIGIRFETETEKFSDSLKREKRCQIQIRGSAWIADYPDGDNFMQLLYSKNIGESNNSCYKSAEYDRLYELSARLPDGPERDKIYLEMQKQFEADTPWVLGVSRIRNQLSHPWVVGYKAHPILLAPWMYFDIRTDKGR